MGSDGDREAVEASRRADARACAGAGAPMENAGAPQPEREQDGDSFDAFLKAATQVCSHRHPTVFAPRKTERARARERESARGRERDGETVSLIIGLRSQRVAHGGRGEVNITGALRSLQMPVGDETEQATARVRGILDDLLR